MPQQQLARCTSTLSQAALWQGVRCSRSLSLIEWPIQKRGNDIEGQLVSWLISLVTGGVCGSIAGALFKNLNLGPLGNTVAGVVGGVLGGQLLMAMFASDTASGVSGNVAWSGVAGIAIMMLAGAVKNARAKK
jgi:uncharacterized membrane protein YeaQ/YmgE (transglycosylase-associated protein family)